MTADADAEVKPGDTGNIKPGASDEITNGMMDIAKKLVNMADDLPAIKQCMADVKAKVYTPSNQAVVAAGGTLVPKKDSTTGNPV